MANFPHYFDGEHDQLLPHHCLFSLCIERGRQKTIVVEGDIDSCVGSQLYMVEGYHMYMFIVFQHLSLTSFHCCCCRL